jgi:rhamnogalacturonyl hydrolase YesR
LGLWVAAALVAVAFGPGKGWAATVRLQAEAAELVRAAADADHAGYTGQGYARYAAEAGSYVEWVLDVAAATSADPLTLRYANGGDQNRPMKLVVNGKSLAGSYVFPPTGAWTVWQTISVADVPLRQGFNTIRAEAISAAGGPNLDWLEVTSPEALSLTDWGQAVIRSTIEARYPDPTVLGSDPKKNYWNYKAGLYLLGQYRAYQRTGSKSYLSYIKRWVDLRTKRDTGALLATRTDDPTIKLLDTVMPGRVALLLDAEFGGASGTPRYRKTAGRLWSALKTHRRTPDRIFWHNESLPNTVLLDGAYMALPFAMLYGRQFAQTLPGSPDLFDDVANQLVRGSYHLQDKAGSEVAPITGSGLIYHAYDLEGDARTKGVDWTTGSSKHSSTFWCRAMGWYAMTFVDVLEGAPGDAAHQSERSTLVEIFRTLIGGLAEIQGADGRWPTVSVVPPRSISGNYLETSCSAMFVYAISKAIDAGYLNASYAKVASRAYRGVLGQLSLQPETINGGTRYLTFLTGIHPGQGPQANAELYTARSPLTNDLHGLGAFLLMYEQARRRPGTISPF